MNNTNRFEQPAIQATISRHAKSGKLEGFPGLSPEGVAMTEQPAAALVETIENAPAGTVTVLGDISQTPRTRTTEGLYFSRIKQFLEEKTGTPVRFIDNATLKEMTRPEGASHGYTKTAETIVDQAESAPEQKLIIELPLSIRGLSMEDFLYETDRVTVKPAWQSLLDRHGKDYTAAIREWFSGENKALTVAVDPQTVADGFLEGINRLTSFVKKFFPNRSVQIVLVSHSFLIDAALTSLANGKSVTREGFERIGDQVVAEAELSTLIFDASGVRLHYREKEFTLPYEQA